MVVPKRQDWAFIAEIATDHSLRARGVSADGSVCVQRVSECALAVCFFVRIFVISDGINVAWREAGALQAVAKGVHGEAWIVLDAGEAFFRNGRYQPTFL